MLSVIFSLPLPVAFAPLHPWNISPGKKTKQPCPPFTIESHAHIRIETKTSISKRTSIVYNLKMVGKNVFFLLTFG